MAEAQLLIKDEVNVRFKGIDRVTLEKCSRELTFTVPNYKFMPAARFGWDGSISLFKKYVLLYLIYI